MKILKPNWVSHDGNPIFSIDIHPDGSRFATGGQGDNCGRVVIWNMSPLSKKEDEYNENVPKQLCRLDNHLSCVNCVRWSNSGKWLASAGDDKIVMIWQFAGQGGIAFGGVSNAESWRCCNSLRGHSGDILDLNWSPNDNYLATCSIDNTIRIWNAENFPECIKIITGHESFVKGVSWDPMGKYLSTQSDDKSLKIWRTSDWKEEASINKPFIDCGGTTHVLRLNWCPDGQFLISAHSMNCRGSTAQIITREDWNIDKDFVGHRKAVTCVRFNPKFLYKSKKDKKSKFFCVAIGSRDQALSVWLINRKRPLFVMHDLFEETILDISWSQDGYKMLSCSWDGTVAYFEFNEEELGKVLDGDEVSSYLHKLYGKNMIAMQRKTNSTMFIEDVQMLKVRESAEAKRKILSTSQQNSHQNGLSNSRPTLNENTNSNLSRLSKGSTEKQIETRTLDGKRRITPLYIPPQISRDGLPVPFNVENQQPTFSTSKENTSKIQIEKIDSVQSSASLLSNPSPDKRNDTNGLLKQQTSTPQPQTNVNNKQDSSSNEVTSIKKPSHQSVSSKLTQQPKDKATSKASNTSSTEKQQDKTKTNSTSSNNRKINQIDLTTITPAPISKQIPTLSATNSAIAVAATATTDRRAPDKQLKDRQTLFANLFAPKIDKTFSSSLSLEQFKDCTLIVENNLSNSNLCSLRLVDQEHYQLWQVLVSQKILLVTHSDEIVCICCEDDTIHVFNLQTGNRLSTPFLISSPASKLACFKHKILVITVKAELWLWDLKIKRAIVKNISLLPLLHNNNNQADINITNYCITSNGLPLITVSTGKTYVYDLDMETWHLLSNNQDLLNYSCDYKQKITSDSNVADYPLSLIQSQQRFLRQIHNVFVANRSLQPKATLSYIDQQLASSMQLSSSKEYRYWLNILAQFITNEGLEDRFKELCEFLLGPIFTTDSTLQSTILGIDKHELLKDVLLISTGNLKLQRIYNEYKEQLDQVNQMSVDF